MINKQNLWFATLFSLILVLGVYYVTLADESLSFESVIDNSQAVFSLNESTALTALKVANDEEILEETTMYESIILDNFSSTIEKSEAYASLQVLKENIVKAEEIEKIILEKFNLEAFVKFENNYINVTISSVDHDEKIANNIISEVQNLYDVQMYITVKFS